jgi:hypothetical protein
MFVEQVEVMEKRAWEEEYMIGKQVGMVDRLA